jgi:hypothetical protein
MIDTRLTKHIQNIASSKAVAWCIAHPFLATIAYVALVSAFFLAFPQTDLWVSGLFYSQTDGFWAQHNPFLQKVRHLGPYLVQTIAICSVAILVIKLLLPGRPPIVPLRKPVFLISTLILGPGILVNSILKDNWGPPTAALDRGVWRGVAVSAGLENDRFLRTELLVYVRRRRCGYLACDDGVSGAGELAKSCSCVCAAAVSDPVNQPGCLWRALFLRHHVVLGADVARDPERLLAAIFEETATDDGSGAG